MGAGIMVVAGSLVVSGGGRTGAVQDGTAATATRAAEEAELTALRTQVADLSTEVARLGGADAEALAGRLGGDRAGFEEAYGAATAYIGDDQAVYAVAEIGRVTVTFEEGRAVRLVVSPDRPQEKPSDEADPADWSLDEATAYAAEFVPIDSELGGFAEAEDGTLTATGSSAALAEDAATPVATACPPAGDVAFVATLTNPTPETVSALTIELAPDAPLTAPTPAPAAERPSSGGRALVTSSLGGSTAVNGVRVRGIQLRTDEAAASGGGGETVAVELGVENETGGDLLLNPEDFVLVDGREREVPAFCGGVEPILVGEEIPAGETLQGWVSFRVPERFNPERVVYLVNGAPNTRIAFVLD